MNFSSGPLAVIEQEVISCRRCPRLVEHCTEIGRVKRRAYRDWEYWAKPVPAFGDPNARVLILGLAPGAHGSNRTGRPFTGDGSGVTLYRVLHRAGFASQPDSRSRDDGLRLVDAYITAAVRCAPPGNKPAPEEIRRCRPFVERELYHSLACEWWSHSAKSHLMFICLSCAIAASSVAARHSFLGTTACIA